MSSRIILRALGALALAAALACSDAGTDPAPRTPDARVSVAMSVEGTPVVAVTAEVSAPDIPSKLLFSLKVEGGVASGSIEVPAGSDRTVTLRGFDAQGILTHQGSKTVAVQEGTNATLSIVMEPVTGTLPIRASFGSTTVVVSPVQQTLSLGDTARLRATIVGPDGATIDGAVTWATSNPGAVRVSGTGLVTALAPGREADVVATYNGIGAPARIVVLGDGTGGTPDQTAPTLAALSFSPQPLDLTSADSVLRISFRVTDAGVGVARVTMGLRGPGGVQTRTCSASHLSLPAGTPTQDVTWSCTMAFSRHSAHGQWTASVTLTDRNGATRSMGVAALQAAGLPTGASVVSPNEDVSAPVLRGFAFTPDSVAVGSASAEVSVLLSVVDEGVGVSPMQIQFWNEELRRALPCSPTLSSGTPRDGVWTCTLVVPQGTPAGRYQVTDVFLRDPAGNSRVYDAAAFAVRGWITALRVKP